MANSDLTSYIQQQRQLGQTDDFIRQQLLQIGWQPSDVDQAFSPSSDPSSPDPDPPVTSLSGPLDLLQQSIAIFVSRWLTLIVITLIPYVVGMIVGAVTFVAFLLWVGVSLSSFALKQGGLSPMLSPTSLPQLPTSFWILIGVSFFLLFLAIIYIYTWSALAMFYAVANHQERLGVKASYGRAWHKILAYWWMAILFMLILMGGLMLFALPGLIFMIWFYFAFWILVTEDQGGLTALLKSKFYVQGHWWGVFFRILAVMILYFLIYVPLSLVLERVDLGALKIVIDLLMTLSGFVIGPILLIYQFIMYRQLKSLKSGQEFTPSGKSKLAFILISLWGILAMLAVPAAIILVAINPVKQMQRARDASRRSSQMEIQSALERYWATYGEFPATLDQLIEEGELIQIPVDPTTSQPYEYQVLDDGQNYRLCYQDENQQSQCKESDPFFQYYPSIAPSPSMDQFSPEDFQDQLPGYSPPQLNNSTEI